MDRHSPIFHHHNSVVVVAVVDELAAVAAAEPLHVVVVSAALWQMVMGSLWVTGRDVEKHDPVTSVLDSEMVAVNSGDLMACESHVLAI